MLSNISRPYQRQPATNQAPEQSTYLPQPVSNHQSYGFQRDGYGVSSLDTDFHNYQAYRTARRDAMPYAPTLHGQNAEVYPQTPSARPVNSQYGTHLNRDDLDYQQYISDYNEDSESSSTAAVVGSWVSQPSQPVSATQPAYHDPYFNAQTSDPYIPPTHSQLQHEPPMNHGGPYNWVARPVPRQRIEQNTPSSYPYQHSTQLPPPMNVHPSAPSMLNPGPIPTHSHRPQTRFDPAQPMQAPSREMYAPAPAFLPTNYSRLAAQPRDVTVLYPAGYQPYSQRPVQDPSGSIANNAIDHGPFSQVDDSTAVAPTAIPPTERRSSGRNGKGKGKANGRGKRKGKGKGQAVSSR
jgi:hypothetical protein